MISKNELKYLKSLHLKKTREEEKKFIAEGKNSVIEGLKSNYKCSLLLYTESFNVSDESLVRFAGERNVRTEIISESDFQRAADSVNPQGILGVFEMPDRKIPQPEKFNGTVVYLDNIADPGNTGTIIRTCDWFGVRTVILSKNSADIYNSKTVRASAGSLFHVNMYPGIDLTDISDELARAKYKIYASDLAGENLYQTTFDSKSVIIFSNEANGLSEGLLNVINYKITIPKKGNAESLNVASAAAVILSQIVNRT